MPSQFALDLHFELIFASDELPKNKSEIMKYITYSISDKLY